MNIIDKLETGIDRSTLHGFEDVTVSVKFMAEIAEYLKAMRCCGNCKHSLTMSQMGLVDVRPCQECINESKWEIRGYE